MRLCLYLNTFAIILFLWLKLPLLFGMMVLSQRDIRLYVMAFRFGFDFVLEERLYYLLLALFNVDIFECRGFYYGCFLLFLDFLNLLVINEKRLTVSLVDL